MRLYQNQTYRVGDGAYVRITHLDRKQVDYKELPHPDFREGSHRSATKKEFCRLVKTAVLLTRSERGEWLEPAPKPAPTPAAGPAEKAEGEEGEQGGR